MSERLDPEVMQALQNELFEELTAAVQSFGGFVDKFIGDALLDCLVRRPRTKTTQSGRPRCPRYDQADGATGRTFEKVCAGRHSSCISASTRAGVAGG